MATIKSSIKLYDGVSPVLKSMTKAMNIAINSFEAMQTASADAVDTSSIKAARSELNAVETELDRIEANIRTADGSQQRFNSDMAEASDAASTLRNKIMGVAGALGAAVSAKKVIELADSMNTTKARLDLMNDGLQTTEELQNKIMASAQRSRAAYDSTASAVAKLGIMAGDAFKSNDEIIAFAEQVNKQFTIAGASTSEASNAMLQLTQAMASGVLRGDELNSIFEQAPTLIQAIADYMGVPIGSIRKMASEGQITADIIKNAMFATAEETNARFEAMPLTFAQLWQNIQNQLLTTFTPLLETIAQGATFIADNWAVIEPILLGLAAAATAYAIALGIQTAATWIADGAAKAFFTTLLSNPLFWIALAIGVVVAAIARWVESVGGIKIAWMMACNAILTAWDWVKIGFFTGIYWVIGLWEKLELAFKTVSTNIANFMGDLKANVLTILQNMVNGAIDIINGFINILNKIPGVSIEAIGNVTFGTTAQLENAAAKSARNAELASYRSQLEANAASRDAALESMKADARSATAAREADISAARVSAASGSDSIAAMTFDNIAQNIEDTAGNTAAMKDSMDTFEDSLEYMVDLAEREAINRYTTAEIKVEMGGITQNVNSEADLDGICDALSDKIYEAMVISAEGVHY